MIAGSCCALETGPDRCEDELRRHHHVTISAGSRQLSISTLRRQHSPSMNAIIALCHFCEYHGPSVLFCTQTFHCEDHNPLNSNQSSSSAECISCIKRKFARTDSSSSSSSMSAHGTVSKASQCEACHSLDPTHPGFVSIDHEAHISYYSNRSPQQPEVYSVVRQACVRSLSCEVCPGREGPMFFGEEATGYVFTHTFFLKDIQSRGFQRWYSIIAVMNDRIYLVNSWPFLVRHFRDLIDELQAKANSMYEAEHAESAQKRQHIQPSANSFLLTPEQFRRQRGGHKAYRSMSALLKDKHLFSWLHKRFSWILKAGGNRVTEKLLEGPPKEELLTDLEAQGAHEEDKQKDQEECEGGHADARRFTSLRHMLKILGRQHFHLLAYHVIQGNQVIVRGSDRRLIQSALTVLKVLIPSGCCSCVSYSRDYKDSWRCNFLGLAPGAEIPPHVLSSDLFVLLDISNPQDEEIASTTDQQTPEFDPLQNYGFVVLGKEHSPSPSILMRIEKSLLNANLSDAVFDHMLVCLKEEWMDKVKVVFKFARSGPSTTEDKEKLLQILGAKQEDEIVLKFWMTGLNKQYRSHLLTCTSTGSESRE